MFGIEFFIAFGIGVLISGGAIALYSNVEEIRQAIRNLRGKN